MNTHTHNETTEKPVGTVRVSEFCIRCRIRPVAIDRAFQFINGIRVTIRSTEPVCRFCQK